MILVKSEIDIVVSKAEWVHLFEKMGFKEKEPQKNEFDDDCGMLHKKVNGKNIYCFAQKKHFPAFLSNGFSTKINEGEVELKLDDNSKKNSRGRASVSK